MYLTISPIKYTGAASAPVYFAKKYKKQIYYNPVHAFLKDYGPQEDIGYAEERKLLAEHISIKGQFDSLPKTEIKLKAQLKRELDRIKLKLLKSHLLLICSIAREKKIPGCCLEDLHSAGTQGFFDAVDKFDLSNTNTLATYAHKLILQPIQKEVKQYRKGIPASINYMTLEKLRPGYHVPDENGKPLNKAEKKKRFKEKCKAAGLLDSKGKIAVESSPLGLGISSKDKDGKLSDTLNLAHPQFDPNKRDFVLDVKHVLSCLTPREREAFFLYYGMNYSAEEISKVHGGSRSLAEKLARRGRDKIRDFHLEKLRPYVDA